ILVQDDLGDFRGLQCVDDEGCRILRPRDDVDLLTLKFANDGLNTRAAHTDAGAYRIDRGIVRDDGNLRARTRIAGDRLDLDDAIIDFRHFHGEQLDHELRMRARQEDLRATLFATYVIDIGAHAVAVTEGLARDHFVAADDAFTAAEIDNHVTVFDPLHGAVDDFANAILELVILAVALGLAHLLDDDLLCRLGG